NGGNAIVGGSKMRAAGMELRYGNWQGRWETSEKVREAIEGREKAILYIINTLRGINSRRNNIKSYRRYFRPIGVIIERRIWDVLQLELGLSCFPNCIKLNTLSHIVHFCRTRGYSILPISGIGSWSKRQSRESEAEDKLLGNIERPHALHFSESIRLTLTGKDICMLSLSNLRFNL